VGFLIRRAGLFAGLWGSVLIAFAATRFFTSALVDAHFAVVFGILGGTGLVVCGASLQGARDLGRIAAASRVRAEPSQREIRGWVLKWAGAEVLVGAAMGALGFVTFGVGGGIAGSVIAAVVFGSAWVRTIRRFRAYRRGQANAG
jgi:hypothetical protein